MDAATFEARSYESLEADVSIREYLNGHVKPHDGRVGKGRPPCLRTAPRLPPRALSRRGARLRAAERRLSSLEARAGSRASPQAAPSMTIVRLATFHRHRYDVCSLLLALEDASHVGAEQLAPSPVHLHGTTHRMYLEEGNQIPLDGVTELLRTTFLEVVRLGRECEAARAAAASQRENGSMGDEDRSPPRKVQRSPTPDPDDLSGD